MSGTHEPLQPTSASHRRVATGAMQRYGEALWDDSNLDGVMALEYLEARGLTPQTVRGSHLGVVSDPLPGHEHVKGMLSLPYMSQRGEALALRFRCIQEHDCKANKHGKYMSLPHEPGRIYNVQGLKSAGQELHVTEGEFDCLTLSQCGLPAIGLPGASTWNGAIRNVLAGYPILTVWADPDAAGMALWGRLSRSIHRARLVPLKMDVNDTFVKGGQEAIISLLRELDAT